MPNLVFIFNGIIKFWSQILDFYLKTSIFCTWLNFELFLFRKGCVIKHKLRQNFKTKWKTWRIFPSDVNVKVLPKWQCNFKHNIEHFVQKICEIFVKSSWWPHFGYVELYKPLGKYLQDFIVNSQKMLELQNLEKSKICRFQEDLKFENAFILEPQILLGKRDRKIEKMTFIFTKFSFKFVKKCRTQFLTCWLTVIQWRS